MEQSTFSIKSIIDRPIFTYCAGFSLLLFALNFILSDCPSKIGLVPANTLITNTYVWNLVTSCFFETNAVKLAFELFVFWFATRPIIEPSFEQFGLYFAFSVLACTMGTSVYCFIRFFTSGNELLLITPVYGLSGINISLLMYVRQQMRNESVHHSYPIITYHHLPVLLLSIQLILALLGLKSLSADLPFSIAGLFFSWSYLRFYFRYSDVDSSVGDKSDDFAFIAMFPEVSFSFLEVVHTQSSLTQIYFDRFCTSFSFRSQRPSTTYSRWWVCSRCWRSARRRPSTTCDTQPSRPLPCPPRRTPPWQPLRQPCRNPTWWPRGAEPRP